MNKQSRPAAVLVLHEQATNSIILTKRSHDLRDHPGEVCFPGGRWEMQDKTLAATALRELHEELGITSDRVVLKQPLKSEQTLTGYLIYPWLATIETLMPYTLNIKEVSDVFQVSIDKVRNRNNYHKIEVERQGVKFMSYQFNAEQQHFIWGATARIMMQLCGLENIVN